jgi:diguanylate cyclase (GGDEF)-like protein
VQTDPALIGRLLQQANSAALGGRPVVAVSEAVSRMGLQSVRQLALSFSLIDQFSQGNCSGFDYAGFWGHSLLMGLAMKEFGSQLRLGSPDELFSCGLLARVGCLALATAYPHEVTKLLLSGAKGVELLALEQQQLATNHLQMSVTLLTDWGLPTSLTEPILFQEEPTLAKYDSGTRAWKFVHSLHFSLKLADLLLAPQLEQTRLIADIQMLAAKLGLELDALSEQVDQITQQWHLWGKTLQMQTSDLLPFEQMVQATRPPDQHTDEQWLRLLVVDDDPVMRSVLETFLKELCQYTVRFARDGHEALNVALEFNPHVVMTDWLMPVMDGLALCKALRASDWGKNIYVLMLTSVESEDELVTAFEAGVDDYLTKPINRRALKARLKAAWRYARLRDAWESDQQRMLATANELTLANRRLKHASLTDELTELSNRRAGLAALQQASSAALRRDHPLSVISVDVDHFKKINDQYGHATGDQVLQSISRCLRETARREDTVCRWGGEEFLVICPDLSLRDGAQAAERLRKKIADLPVVVSGKAMPCTVSLGLASWVNSMTSVDQLLAEADKALYAAKSGGRNRVAVIMQGKVHMANGVSR